MKNSLLILAISMVFYSCQTGEPSEEMLKLENEKEELKIASAKKDSAFVALVRSFNEIEENLSKVNL